MPKNVLETCFEQTPQAFTVLGAVAELEQILGREGVVDGMEVR